MGVVRLSIVVLVASCCVAQDPGFYDGRYDYLDVDGILDSKRLVRNYVDCLINVKPCTPEGKALKRVLPEALRTKCARCSERQKRVAVKVIRRMKTEYPREWGMLAMRWDPTGDFSAYFERVIPGEDPANPSQNEIQPPAVRPVFVRQPSPPPPPQTPTTTAPVTNSAPTMPPPLLLNRFGDDEDAENPMPMPSNNNAQKPESMSSTPPPPPPTLATDPRPTAIAWDSATPAPAPSNPTRFTMRPMMGQASMTPLYVNTMSLIDHLNSKIMRTTALVADIVRNTVKVLGG